MRWGKMPLCRKLRLAHCGNRSSWSPCQQSGRTQFILAGIEAHVCVFKPGLDLLDLGYKVHVLSDGVFSRSAENHDLALQRMHDARRANGHSSVEMVLFDLIRNVHPSGFLKPISKLVNEADADGGLRLFDFDNLMLK